jgi:micrococcal nuclease
MRRWLALLVLATLAAGWVAAHLARPVGEGRFTLRGTVKYVIDGDTLGFLRDGTARVEHVRLIGIDAPEFRECLSRRATETARSLAHNRRVTVKGDPTQDTRDQYGRRLAYVWLPGGRDLGFQMLERGLARVFVYDRDHPFQRVSAYRRAEQAGRTKPASIWRRCPPQP